MAIGYSDTLAQVLNGLTLGPFTGVYVGLVSNNTGTFYKSDTSTDNTGKFTFATKPPGDTYTVYTSVTGGGTPPGNGWVATGVTSYAVPVVQGENPAFQSETAKASGPYTATAVAAGADYAAAVRIIGGSPWIDVTHPTYGADPTGVADSTTAIQAALNATPTGGCTVWFPPGTYVISSALTVPRTTLLLGAGRDISIIQSASTTNDGILFNADYCAIQDIKLVNTQGASQSAGSAVVFNSSNFPQVRQCHIGWYNGVKNVSGFGWTVRDCNIVPINYGIYQQNPGAPDAGDPTVIGNTISFALASAGSGIRIESGGGMKIVGNKITKGAWSVDLQVADGATTSVLLINDNSFEIPGSGNIRLARSGTTGVYAKIVISGNQLNLTGLSAPGDSIQIGAGVNMVDITGNIIEGTASQTTAVHLKSTSDNVSVWANQLQSHLVGIAVDVNCDLHLGPNKARAVTTYFSTAQSLNSSLTPLLDHEFRVDLGNITSSVTYSNFFALAWAANRGGTLVVDIAGIVQGKGPYAVHYEKIITRVGSANLTLADMFGPTLAGQAVDVQFDVATTAGTVNVGVRVNAAGGGTAVNGVMQIKVTGNVNNIQQLVA